MNGWYLPILIGTAGGDRLTCRRGGGHSSSTRPSNPHLCHCIFSIAVSPRKTAAQVLAKYSGSQWRPAGKEPASAAIYIAYTAPLVSTRSATEPYTFLETYIPKYRLSAVRAGIPLSGERSDDLRGRRSFHIGDIGHGSFIQ